MAAWPLPADTNLSYTPKTSNLAWRNTSSPGTVSLGRRVACTETIASRGICTAADLVLTRSVASGHQLHMTHWWTYSVPTMPILSINDHVYVAKGYVYMSECDGCKMDLVPTASTMH